MGAYPESVAVALGFQFLHIALEVIAHQLDPTADVATDGFFPKALSCSRAFSLMKSRYARMDSGRSGSAWRAASSLHI
jgi:hypothetical protein